MSAPDQSFMKTGYAVLPNALTDDELNILRDACQVLLDEPVDDGGGDRHKIGLGASRRFLAHRHEEFADVSDLILGEKLARIVAKHLGTPGYLFNEQFVVKGSGTGASFAWHQDSAYVGYDHKPYLSVWMALDDTNIENGCVYIIPRDLDANPGIDHHEWVEESRELNGYFGEDEGEAMTCPAGSIVVFSSLTLHRSGPNTTNKLRRAYLCQYSAEPLVHPETGEQKRFAKPMPEAA